MYQLTSVEISDNTSVEEKPVYLHEESSPVVNKHVFVCFITIRDMGKQPVCLLQRHWEIKDSGGHDHEVEGVGVIGLQSTVEPNEELEYNSFCVLKCYCGSSRGYYTVERNDGELIKVRMAEFLLISHPFN